MLNPVFTTKFKKDLELMNKRGENMNIFKALSKKLINQEMLEARYKDHKLSGIYKNRRECHIAPDWLLIYKIEGDVIIFERTGSHSDLF
jgi:mRNA interferase YafQ